MYLSIIFYHGHVVIFADSGETVDVGTFGASDSKIVCNTNPSYWRQFLTHTLYIFNKGNSKDTDTISEYQNKTAKRKSMPHSFGDTNLTTGLSKVGSGSRSFSSFRRRTNIVSSYMSDHEIYIDMTRSDIKDFTWQ